MSTNDSIREACEQLNASDPTPNDWYEKFPYGTIGRDGDFARLARADYAERKGSRRSPWARTALTALALTAALSAPALATDANAPALNVPPSVAAIAPGGNISSVVQATETYGWPHSPTVNERIDVTRLVLALKVPRSGSVRCVFGFTMGRSTCTTKIGRTSRAWNVKVWEDGSYRITRR